MKNLNFSPLKKLEIIMEGEGQEFATDLLDRAGVKGYTIINNLSGKGSHGFHEGPPRSWSIRYSKVLRPISTSTPESCSSPTSR
jgi:hypothetical protein